MKLDPGIHIVMHSILSLKPGVTGEGPPLESESKRPKKLSKRVFLFWALDQWKILVYSQAPGFLTNYR